MLPQVASAWKASPRLMRTWTPSLRLSRRIQAPVARVTYTTKSKVATHDPRVFRVAEEIQEAVHSGKPVVALETTIYTHGFPYPDNVALASHLESVVRLNGAIPATIGILDGVARVGLSTEELLQLTSAAGKPETMKISRRDLPYITGLGLAGRKIHGGTTISGTMILSQMAGIEVFGTGGLGGVHRGGENSMDVSADLTELGRTPVTVISSGCKSFLDLARTLEYLETQGVCVGTFRDGRSGPIDMPAFYTRDSGIRSPVVIENEKEAAAIIYARRLLGSDSGLHFANPIPEEFSIPQSEINTVIDAAVKEAAEKGFHGHANTPFILAKIKELTGGKSIPANRALIDGNVKRAAKVAVELSKLAANKQQTSTFMPSVPPVPQLLKSASPHPVLAPSVTKQTLSRPEIFVAGSVAVDLSCDFRQFGSSKATAPILQTSNPASIRQSIGGVGHNVAAAAHLVSSPGAVRLCTLVADDLAGNLIISTLKERGLDTSGIQTLPTTDNKSGEKWRTAQYIAVNDAHKDLVLAMADMDIVGSPLHDVPATWEAQLESAFPRWVVVDGNWHVSLIKQWSRSGKAVGANVAFEPVSVEKAARAFPSKSSLNKLGLPFAGAYPDHEIDLASPNEYELEAMHQAAKNNEYFEEERWWEVIDALGIPSSGARVQMVNLTTRDLVDKGIPQMVVQLLPFMPTILTKLGPSGLLVTRLLGAEDPELRDPAHTPYILSRCTNGSSKVGGIYMRLYPPAALVRKEDIVSVNGIGDTFLGVLIAGLAKGMKLEDRLVDIAQRAAVLTLKSPEAVSPKVETLAKELM